MVVWYEEFRGRKIQCPASGRARRALLPYIHRSFKSDGQQGFTPHGRHLCCQKTRAGNTSQGLALLLPLSRERDGMELRRRANESFLMPL